MDPTPETIYYGARATMLNELGDHLDVYPGAYLICPDGAAAWDAESADTVDEMKECVSYFRTLWPNARFVRL
jgi:hypothetical protein